MAPKKPLIGSQMFVRILPKMEVGGHADGGEEVYKKLKGWTEGEIELEDRHGVTKYTFPKKVLDPEVSQDEMYNTVMENLESSFTQFEGYNVLLFAYGQTGTGKTHTMFGPDEALGSLDSPDWGIFPRVVSAVFRTMGGKSFILSASAVDFYAFFCYDLLNKREFCEVNNDHVPIGQKQMILRKPEDVVEFLEIARKERKTTETNMNLKSGAHGGSSRSHCALILTLLQVDEEGNLCKTIFNLVDLAGAERPDKTGGTRTSAFDALIEMYKTGKMSVGAEGTLINYELSDLSTQVCVATDKNKKGISAKPVKALSTAAIRYMGACLDGSAKLGMIICLSQAVQCGWETWFSCNYGTELGKLKVPLKQQPKENIDKAIKKAENELKKAEDLLASTAESGTPASKYYKERKVNVRNWGEYIPLLQELQKSVNKS